MATDRAPSPEEPNSSKEFSLTVRRRFVNYVCRSKEIEGESPVEDLFTGKTIANLGGHGFGGSIVISSKEVSREKLCDGIIFEDGFLINMCPKMFRRFRALMLGGAPIEIEICGQLLGDGKLKLDNFTVKFG